MPSIASYSLQIPPPSAAMGPGTDGSLTFISSGSKALDLVSTKPLFSVVDKGGSMGPSVDEILVVGFADGSKVLKLTCPLPSSRMVVKG